MIDWKITFCILLSWLKGQITGLCKRFNGIDDGNFKSKNISVVNRYVLAERKSYRRVHLPFLYKICDLGSLIVQMPVGNVMIFHGTTFVFFGVSLRI